MITVAVSLLLGFPLASFAAEGQFFTSLRAGQFAAFDNVQAVYIRFYAKSLFHAYEQRCPDTAPKYNIPWDLVAYVATPPHPSHDSAAYLYLAAMTKIDEATFARMDGKRDIDSLVDASRCSASVHSGWMNQAKKMLSDPRIAGPLPEMNKVCEAHRWSSDEDCACFALAYDMQSTPAKRRVFIDAAAPLQGLQKTLNDSDFATRVAIKCSGTPNYFRPGLMAQAPPHANQIDDNHRLAEGAYRIKTTQLDTIDRGGFTITRIANWRYQLTWKKLLKVSEQIGILSNDGKELTVYRGEPQPVTFRVLENGTLRGVGANVQFDIVPISADQPAPRTTVPQPPNRSDNSASTEQCARLQRDIDRFRGNPRSASNLAILEKRYASWCAGR
jgi:hypothetical protein